MLQNRRSLWAVMCVALFAPAASFAGPITFTFPSGANTTTQARASVNQNVGVTTDTHVGTTTASASASGFSNTSSVTIDMQAGELKSNAQSVYGFDTVATGWEFLTFSGDGQISYSFDVDGTLSNLNGGGIVVAGAAINIYDVSTWENASGSPYFYDSFGTLVSSPNGSGDTALPYRVSSGFDSLGVQGTTATGPRTCAGQFVETCVTNSSGTAVPVDFQLSGSFNAVQGSLYLLELVLNTYSVNFGVNGSQTQVADFAHTAAFTFTDLSGLSFATSSGQFLNEETQSEVPEPMTIALMGLGAAGAWANRRRARRQQSAA